MLAAGMRSQDKPAKRPPHPPNHQDLSSPPILSPVLVSPFLGLLSVKQRALGSILNIAGPPRCFWDVGYLDEQRLCSFHRRSIIRSGGQCIKHEPDPLHQFCRRAARRFLLQLLHSSVIRHACGRQQLPLLVRCCERGE